MTEVVSTTPQLMRGATTSTDGASGLIIPPRAGDQNKVFKGDGTWGDMEGGHVIVDEDGVEYTRRSKLKFLNSDLTDDAANDTTIVSPRGGGAVIKIGDVEGASATSTPGTAAVVLKWTDPEDIVVSGATLAEWAGTKVIRKAGSAPTSIDDEDATEVVDNKTRNQYAPTGYTDSGLTYGTTYYYRFFPYTTQGAVTDGSSVNSTPDRASVAVPTFDSTMTYDGTQQTATFTGYDSTKMTVSGNTETDAGSYTAKFNVKADYKWSDGTREEKSVSWSIGKKSVTCPTLSGTYTYTGSSQSVTISSYSSSEVTVGGDTSATNAGTYTVTFDLADSSNLIWSDDTSAQKSDDWTIAKAAGSVTLSSNSVTLDADHTSATVTASDATGDLSVSSSATSIATASISGSTITIASVNDTDGTATITVSVAASANYNATTATIAVSADFVTIPTNGLIHEWLMNDYDGSRCSDTKGNIDLLYDASRTGGTLRSSIGLGGKNCIERLHPNGVQLKTTITDFVYGISNAFSVSVWAKANTASGVSYYLLNVPSNYTGGGAAFVAISTSSASSLGDGTHFYILFGKGGSGYTIAKANTNLLIDNNWHHWVVVYNGAKKIKAYCDGVYVCECSYPYNDFPGSAWDIECPTGQNLELDTKHQNLRFYNRALTAEEIYQLYSELSAYV